MTLVYMHLFAPFSGLSTLVDTPYRRKRKENEDSCDGVNDVNYGIASFSSWSMSLCNPEMGITRLEGPQRLLPPLKVKHLEQVQTSWLALISPKLKRLVSHMVG